MSKVALGSEAEYRSQLEALVRVLFKSQPAVLVLLAVLPIVGGAPALVVCEWGALRSSLLWPRGRAGGNRVEQRRAHGAIQRGRPVA